MADLKQIFIRVQEPDGKWVNKSLKDCDLGQFLEWAIPRAKVVVDRLGCPSFFRFVAFDDLDELKNDFIDWLRDHGEIVYEVKLELLEELEDCEADLSKNLIPVKSLENALGPNN